MSHLKWISPWRDRFVSIAINAGGVTESTCARPRLLLGNFEASSTGYADRFRASPHQNRSLVGSVHRCRRPRRLPPVRTPSTPSTHAWPFPLKPIESWTAVEADAGKRVVAEIAEFYEGLNSRSAAGSRIQRLCPTIPGQQRVRRTRRLLPLPPGLPSPSCRPWRVSHPSAWAVPRRRRLPSRSGRPQIPGRRAAKEILREQRR